MDEPIWAEVNLKAIRHNVQEIRRLVGPKREIMAVVKANGYGHGSVQVARAALATGATRLAVARMVEAIQLRQAGISVPILILGYVPAEQVDRALEQDITLTVYRLDMAQEIAALAAKKDLRAKVHLKIDTGMGRLGFIPGTEGATEIKQVWGLKNLEVEGIYTHFATADETDKGYAKEQFAQFLSLLNNLESEGITFPLRHCANSAAIIDLPETYLDMVRPGIILYGLYPSTEVDQTKVSLQPAMTLKTQIAHVKKVPTGTKLSYGSTYTVPEETVIATLPIGYADGYPRLLSSRGNVLIHGQKAPVLGRVCMDQCMVNVGHISGVKIHDEAIIFGQNKDNNLPVEEVATQLGTINYEVVCWVGGRVPRVYIE